MLTSDITLKLFIVADQLFSVLAALPFFFCLVFFGGVFVRVCFHHAPSSGWEPVRLRCVLMASFSQRSHLSLCRSQADLTDSSLLFPPRSTSAATRRSAPTSRRTSVECVRGTTLTVAPWSWRSPRPQKRTVNIDCRPAVSSAALLHMSYYVTLMIAETLTTCSQSSVWPNLLLDQIFCYSVRTWLAAITDGNTFPAVQGLHFSSVSLSCQDCWKCSTSQ